MHRDLYLMRYTFEQRVGTTSEGGALVHLNQPGTYDGFDYQHLVVVLGSYG